MATESGLESPGLSNAAPTPPDPDASGPPGEDPAAQAVARALHAVEAALRAEPHSFGFFQAVHLLERLRPGRAPAGGFGDPASEVVRFGVPPTLGFPASEIQELELRTDAPAAMRVNCFGVTGPQGVLPHDYTLLVAERLRARDAALADFLDIFHHRLVSLFYQAWRKYRFAVAQEGREQDRLARHLLDLVGLGLPAERTHLPFPPAALIFRAGLLAPQPRGAAALEQLLGDFFAVPVAIEQFVGGWYPLDTPERCALGAEEPTCVLGGGAVAGDEIWDQQARVRVRIGPLARPRYDDFLPGGGSHDALAALLRFFGHDQYEFDVQLVLTAAEVPGVVLGGTADQPPRLGWSTWIRSGTRLDDADDTILNLQTGAVS
jgi:type VI secretion system protein ImpH